MDVKAILCDYAQVNGGKLYVVGAAVNLLATPSPAPPHPITAAVGVLITVPWNAHNQVHRLKISLVSEDGQVVHIADPLPGQELAEEDLGAIVGQFNAGRSPLMQAGDDSILPIAVSLNVQVPSLGGYVAKVQIDGSVEAEARFRVVHRGMPFMSS